MIGIFDSGIGGLTVLRACHELMPKQSFLYLGDKKNAPYGSKSANEIHELTRNAVRYLFDQGCDLVILACNTASAVALHDLQVNWLKENDEGRNRRVLGVFVPIIEAMTSRDWGDNSPPTHTGLKDLLLFATEASVRSGAFSRELKFRARDVQVVEIACPHLAEAIEKGDDELAETEVNRAVAQGLSEISSPQSAALCCTHYPIVNEKFVKALPKSTTVFSQGDIVAQSLSDYLTRFPHFKTDGGELKFFTTGRAIDIEDSAQLFWGEEIKFAEVSY